MDMVRMSIFFGMHESESHLTDWQTYFFNNNRPNDGFCFQIQNLDVPVLTPGVQCITTGSKDENCAVR